MEQKNVKYLIIALLGIVTTTLAQTNPSGLSAAVSAASGPRIAFEMPVYDFGKVDSGEKVEHDFIFTNIGDQLLEVKDVHPGCGCTTAGAWDKKVEPGKTGKIPIQFNSSGYGGAVQKTVSVTCNDPTQSSLTLQLKGTIWKAFSITPSYLVFNVSPDNQGYLTNSAKIVSNLDEPVTVSNAICGNASFKTELVTLREGKEFELRVILAVAVATGNDSAPITIKTSAPKMPVISVTAYTMVQPLLVLMPPQVMLSPGPLTNEQQITVTIQNNSTNPLILTDSAINVPKVDIQVKEVVPGRRFNLMMTFPKGFQKEPDKNIEATVKTSSAKNPVIKISVNQQAPPEAPAKPAATKT